LSLAVADPIRRTLELLRQNASTRHESIDDWPNLALEDVDLRVTTGRLVQVHAPVNADHKQALLAEEPIGVPPLQHAWQVAEEGVAPILSRALALSTKDGGDLSLGRRR